MFLSDIRARNIVGTIFSFLENPQDLAKGERVCRVWRDAAIQMWKNRWQDRLNLGQSPAEPLSREQKEALYSEYRVRRLTKVEEPFTYNHVMRTDMSVANGSLFRPLPSVPKLQQVDFQTQQVVHTYSMGSRYVAENNRLVFYGESYPVEIWDIATRKLLLSMDMDIDSNNRVSVNELWMVSTIISTDHSSNTITHSVISLDERRYPFSISYEEGNLGTEILLHGNRLYSLCFSPSQLARKSSLRVWDLTTRKEIGFLESENEAFVKMAPWNDEVIIAREKSIARWKPGQPHESPLLGYPQTGSVFLFHCDKQMLALGIHGDSLRFYSPIDGSLIREFPENIQISSSEMDITDKVISLLSFPCQVTQYVVPTMTPETNETMILDTTETNNKRKRSDSLDEI